MPSVTRGKDGAVVGMNVPALQLVLAAVQNVLVNSPHLRRFGVCGNVDLATRGAGVCGYEAMRFFSESWPHAVPGGRWLDQAYFIPDQLGVGKWEGQNLRMRIDFMEHVIREINIMLKEQGAYSA